MKARDWSMCLLSVLSICFWATAAKSEKAIVDAQGAFILTSDDDTLALGLFGPITASTVTDFLNITRSRDVQLLLLDSPGGDLDAGITIAELVALRRMDTWIAEEATCASACSLIFFSGNERSLFGRLGVHQYRTVGGTPDDEGAAQEKIGRLIELLNSFAAPPIVVEKMAITKPECMYWFGREHSAMVQRGNDMAFQRLDGELDCPDAESMSPAGLSPVPLASVESIRRAVQTELNRLGCSLGTPDGLIGPSSRRALLEFSKARGIKYDITSFDKQAFLEEVSAIQGLVCLAPPALIAPDIAGEWSLSARCPYTTAAVEGFITAIRKSEGRYTLLYSNNLGDSGIGTIIQKGRQASVTVHWNNGQSNGSVMTINSAGNQMSGRSTNGCVFEAWR